MAYYTVNIIQDTSGTLREDCFFELTFSDSESSLLNAGERSIRVDRASAEFRTGCYHSPFVSLAVAVAPDVAYIDCPNDPMVAHYSTRVYRRRRPKITVLSGEVWSPLNGTGPQEWWRDRAVVTEEVYSALSNSDLVGMELIPVDVSSVRALSALPLSAWLWQPLGMDCQRPCLIHNAENACPFCHQGAVVCDFCGHVTMVCPNCHEIMCTPELKGPGDRRLLLSDVKQRNAPVLDGSRWDGSDCFVSRGTMAVSKRVLECLLAIHAAPFIAEPAQVWIDKMTPAQLERLELIRQPLVP
jgi:hypothetical protein